ncbi:hypothetical protein NDU88_005143 [Pleurodeles waltl]|uniref:Uncharacterized protein n=1 Tax=Pleurodeles waltl TaxID=8319 RepID=A0AAV7KZY7_PLEWA|nr:hypothetical protein NDU88_005143 [Pleurodeles waltl]
MVLRFRVELVKYSSPTLSSNGHTRNHWVERPLLKHGQDQAIQGNLIMQHKISAGVPSIGPSRQAECMPLKSSRTEDQGAMRKNLPDTKQSPRMTWRERHIQIR